MALPFVWLSGGAAVLYGLVLATRPPTPLRSLVKTAAPVLLLVGLALDRGPVLMAAALLFGAMTDYLLSREPERRITNAVFATYTIALALAALHFGLRWSGLAGGAQAVAALVIFGTALLMFVLPRIEADKRVGAAVHTVMLLILCFAAFGAEDESGYARLGAILIAARTLLHGSELAYLPWTSPYVRLSVPAVWLLSYGGWLCFVLSATAA
ncbi:MAG: hypothetical protein ACPGID_13070 [Rubricella sp.]